MKTRNLGQQDYQDTWDKMRAFTNARNENTEDELWIVQHPAVFTEGIASKAEHFLLEPGLSKIPIVKTDRGGQITYHGPGQLIVYCLIDIKRLGIGIKKMVSVIEATIIELLQTYGVDAHLTAGAPGVYIDGAKIAALGLKVKNGRTYHGLSLNIKMDLSPFQHVNPCGYPDLKVTQLSELTDNTHFEKVATDLCNLLKNNVANHRN